MRDGISASGHFSVDEVKKAVADIIGATDEYTSWVIGEMADDDGYTIRLGFLTSERLVIKKLAKSAGPAQTVDVEISVSDGRTSVKCEIVDFKYTKSTFMSTPVPKGNYLDFLGHLENILKKLDSDAEISRS
jgi:hypothetical protein